MNEFSGNDDALTMMIVSDEPCRMAYAVDGRQPVRCTLIGDQPLFYMDFEAAEDEVFEDGFGFAAVEKSLSALREKISQLDALTPGMGPAASALARFDENADIICTARTHSPMPACKPLEALLRQSRFAAALLDLGANFGPVMHYSRQHAGAFYDRLTGAIYVHPDLPAADQVLLAARELRRLWQHRNGALLHPLTFHPDQAILINRAQIADLTAAMARIAWDLQLAGEKDAWYRLESSSLGDLARAFAREALGDFRTLGTGTAAAMVFESWFLSERCRAEDRKLIQQMLADYQGYVFGDAEISQNVTGELIVALGSMPFGKNYLLPYAQNIIKDPVFTDVRDRSNANFLWFIKFERSFREAEQVTLGQAQGFDTPRAAPTESIPKKSAHGGTVVAFPAALPVAAMQKKPARGAGQVIAFRPAEG